MNRIKSILKELQRYPSAVFGLFILLILSAIAVYALIAIPYDEAVRLWRGSEADWYKNPKSVWPIWRNWFTAKKLPVSFDLSTAAGDVEKLVTANQGTNSTEIVFPVEFYADEFPQEMILYFKSQFTEKKPFAQVSWIYPNGDEIRLGDFSIERSYSYRISQDAKLQRRLGGTAPMKGLFVQDPKSEVLSLQKGNYQLKVVVTGFEETSNTDVELVFHGLVAGWAGTDHLRRDLMVALLWGTPVALSFGLLASLGITLSTMTIAAAGVWFGGWVDELIQRITEVNLVIPFLPILIMIGTFYSRSIFVLFIATIALSIFGGGIKTYRAAFLQIKESPFIEAARAYGASNGRIIIHYLIPRLVPLLIPALVTGIPAYVFLETSLAVLGLGDPTLPTWGKVINDAQNNGALYLGQYYWVLEPSVMLMFAGLAFALLGFSLDRIFNPRLRGM